MVLSKLDLAFVAIVAAGLLWIKHEYRIIVGTPAAAKVAPAANSVCPATDDVPFSADCIKFISGGIIPNPHAAVSVPPITPANAVEDVHDPDSHAPACPPSNENAPYSASGLSFLSAWFFQPFPKAQAR